jgi:hypothetical protein
MASDLQAAARNRAPQVHVLYASRAGDLDAIFESLVHIRAGALLIATHPLFIGLSDQLAAAAVQHATWARFNAHPKGGGQFPYRVEI